MVDHCTITTAKFSSFGESSDGTNSDFLLTVVYDGTPYILFCNLILYIMQVGDRDGIPWMQSTTEDLELVASEHSTGDSRYGDPVIRDNLDIKVLFGGRRAGAANCHAIREILAVKFGLSGPLWRGQQVGRVC
jgi:hypothetical protein